MEGVNEIIPFGVKYARVLNLIKAVVLIAAGLCFAAIAIPNFIKAAQAHGKTANPLLLLIIGLASSAIGFVPAFLLLRLNKALAQLNKQARVWQILVSVLFLFLSLFQGFKGVVGIVAEGISLYFLLLDPKTRTAFENQSSLP